MNPDEKEVILLPHPILKVKNPFYDRSPVELDLIQIPENSALHECKSFVQSGPYPFVMENGVATFSELSPDHGNATQAVQDLCGRSKECIFETKDLHVKPVPARASSAQDGDFTITWNCVKRDWSRFNDGSMTSASFSIKVPAAGAKIDMGCDDAGKPYLRSTGH